MSSSSGGLLIKTKQNKTKKKNNKQKKGCNLDAKAIFQQNTLQNGTVFFPSLLLDKDWFSWQYGNLECKTYTSISHKLTFLETIELEIN